MSAAHASTIAARGAKVAAAWFTMAGGKPRLNAAFSADSGGRFGDPIPVDDGQPLGRVVVSIDEGAALVGWLEQSDKGAELRVRRIAPDGARGKSLAIGGSSAARSSGFPRMAASGGEVVFAWRDGAEPPNLRTAVLSMSSLLR